MGSLNWINLAAFFLMVTGLILMIRDSRSSRPIWKRDTSRRLLFGRHETWPSASDHSSSPLTPYKLACWLDRRKPQWPLPSKASQRHYEAIVTALTDGRNFGNERPLGSQSPEWDLTWGAQVHWEKTKIEGTPDKTHEIELTRSLVRRYIQSIKIEIPEFLDEKYDDRFPWK